MIRRSPLSSCSPVGAALAAALAGSIFLAASASAVPLFARKYGVACGTCHEVWPRLNDFGQRFRDNGYRMKGGKDEPVEQSPAYWPITFRTTVGYSFLRQTLVPVDNGSTAAADGTTATNGTITTNSGQFGFSGLDIHSIGTLGEHVSFMITYTPFLASSGFGRGAADGNLETAYAGIHEILGSTWLNFRIGKMAPDLPEDEHRQIQFTQGYNSYHYLLPGSAQTFQPGNNQTGFEVYGHDQNSRNRVSISAFNQNGWSNGTNGMFNSPVVWGHASHTHYLDNDFLPSVRVGLFGAVGWQPTSFETCTAGASGTGTAACQPGATGGTANTVPFSGSNSKAFNRVGGEVHLYFLNTYFPLHLQGVLFRGSEDQNLIAGATQDGSWIGGWVEASYTPDIHWNLTLKYERIGVSNNGGTGAPTDAGNASFFTASLRHTFELTSRTEAAFHLEVSNAAVTRQDPAHPTQSITPSTLQVLAAIDYAY